MDTAKTADQEKEEGMKLMQSEVQDPQPVSDPKNVTFTVGELIYPAGLDATFRVLSVGETAIRIYRVSPKVIVPRAPFRVRFKNVLFRVGFWNKSLPREFVIHHTNE